MKLEENLMTLDEVLTLLNMSKSTWYGGKGHEARPKPVRFGPRTLRWIRQEIEDYVRSCRYGGKPSQA